MKSYTDLEQSKKLAEILTLQSADMHSEAIEIDGDMIKLTAKGLDYANIVWEEFV